MIVVFPRAYVSPQFAPAGKPASYVPSAGDTRNRSQKPLAGTPSGDDGVGKYRHLRETVRRLERGAGAVPHPAVPLGFAPIDEVLAGGGLAAGALHEVLAGASADRVATHDAAALGFATLLLARFAARPQPDGSGRILWCRPGGQGFDAMPYAPALAGLLDPARLWLTLTRRREQTLWAIEEGLRCASLAAVLGEIDTIDLVASRRLQLAAEKSGVPVILLRTGERTASLTSAASTRWCVHSLASVSTPGLRDVGAARWGIELLRDRAGDPARRQQRSWIMEWTDEDREAHRLALAAAPVDRSAGAPLGTGNDQRQQPARLAG
jgi:protein ImuA